MPAKELKTGTLHRSFVMNRSAIDEDQRTVPLSFSSEEPYKRWFGTEILDHSATAVRLDRMKQSGPLLVDHDTRDHVGVVEDIQIDSDKTGRAVVRFGKSPRAQEIFQDVQDGIRVNVSVGYQIHRMVLEDPAADEEVYRAVDWEPLEISLVSVPADTTVGVSRSVEGDHLTVIETKNQPVETIEEPAQPIMEKKIMATVEVTPAVEQKRDLQAEAVKILEIADQHEAHQLASEHLRKGSSVEEFVCSLLERQGAAATPATPEIGMSQAEVKNFSFIRAINALANPTDRRAQEAAGFEFECSEAAQKHLGRTASGILVPDDVLSAKRDLTVGTAAAGGNLKGTDHLGSSFIDVLRSQLISVAMGARTLTGLIGDIAIPSLTAGTAAYWVAESGVPTEGAPTFGQVTMAPKTVGAYVDISRKLLKQSSPDIEMLIMEDLAKNLAIEIDKKALYGTGSSGQPTGISATTGINAPTAFAAATPTWAEVLAMLGSVAVDNALTGSLGYVTDPALMASLMGTTKDAGSGQFVWSENNTVAGYKAMASSVVTAGDVFFGNWNDLIIGQWGGLDLNLDDKSLSTAGGHRVVALQDCDIAVRHAVSFAFNNDA